VTYRVILQPRVEHDILASADWIRVESKSSAIAMRWVRDLCSKISSLSSKPHRCPIDPDSDAYGEEVHSLFRVVYPLTSPAKRWKREKKEDKGAPGADGRWEPRRVVVQLAYKPDREQRYLEATVARCQLRQADRQNAACLMSQHADRLGSASVLASRNRREAW
jgi:hypothetical protein